MAKGQAGYRSNNRIYIITIIIRQTNTNARIWRRRRRKRRI